MRSFEPSALSDHARVGDVDSMRQASGLCEGAPEVLVGRRPAAISAASMLLTWAGQHGRGRGRKCNQPNGPGSASTGEQHHGEQCQQAGRERTLCCEVKQTRRQGAGTNREFRGTCAQSAARRRLGASARRYNVQAARRSAAHIAWPRPCCLEVHAPPTRSRKDCTQPRARAASPVRMQVRSMPCTPCCTPGAAATNAMPKSLT